MNDFLRPEENQYDEIERPRHEPYRIGRRRSEAWIAIVLGGAVALALFVIMAIAQMIGDVKPEKSDLDDQSIAFVAPELLDTKEEEVVEEKKPEPELELEEEPPLLSLDQLDIALNPGTGGSLMGDFAMPAISTSATALGNDDFFDFSDLDQLPRPLPGTRLDIPTRLKRKAISGTIVLFIQLSEEGDVLDVALDSSNVPAFNDLVLSQVRDWRFSPPTVQGQPVKAQAKLPLPIRIEARS